MINAAYEPFSLNTTSDHRGIILDLHTKTLLGHKEPIAPVTRQDLNANNPIQLDHFLKQLNKLWRSYDIPRRINEANHIRDQRTLRNTVNDINKDITRALLQAEEQVKRNSKPPWSPKLKQASLLVKFYKLV